jgi:hypothetical protein
MGVKKYFHSLWFAVLVLSVFVQAVPTYISDGLMTWQRGADSSTWQDWTFDTAQNPASPEQSYNPYGNPTIQFTGSSGSVPFMWKNGAWIGDPVCATITVPNNPQPNPSKTIWFEMVYKAVDSILPSVSPVQGYQVEQTYFSDRAYSGAWRMMTIGWDIYPNPSSEQFTFALAGTGGYVTSVSIDTLCAVPVPGAALLVSIGLGTIGLIRKRLR